jgi:hypothetical protein
MTNMQMAGPQGPASGAASGIASPHAGIASAHGAVTNILPTWLAVIWTLVFAGVFLIHLNHLRETRGQRRLWHSGHMLMALGMGLMFLPASIIRVDFPRNFWQLAFAGSALVILAFVLTEVVDRRPVNVLWLVMVIDLAAMVYMWSPTAYRPGVTWLLVAYFLAQSALWASDRMRSVDQIRLPTAVAVTPDGAIAAGVAAAPLICFRDIRVSASAMTLGMAYMLAAMQLLM